MRLLLTAVAILTAWPALAQSVPRCGPREAIANILLRDYQEVPTSTGQTRDGKALEIFVSPAGTWTALMTAPGGPSCIVSVGSDWEQGAAPVAGKDA